MKKPIAFYCRAKPQHANAIKIFRESNYVFIGYPLKRKRENGSNIPYDPTALAGCLANPMNDDDWEEQIERHKKETGFKSQQFNKNRNFAKRVTKGSIVVIPRPEEGAVYLGKVISDFRIIDNPQWAKAYLNLRAEQKLDIDDSKNQHIADVCQGWKVEAYKKVDLSKLPAWLRRSLFGRTTFGVFKDHPLDESVTAFKSLADIYEGNVLPPLKWTTNPSDVKNRLIENLTANSFEHLVVSLLQLKHPTEIWHQTGGPGDGGIDGLGSDENGNVTGIMQAKFYSDIAPQLPDLDGIDIRRYAAVLLPEHPEVKTENTELLDINWVATMIIKHSNKMPLAMTMRIGNPKTL